MESYFSYECCNSFIVNTKHSYVYNIIYMFNIHVFPLFANWTGLSWTTDECI